MKIVFGIFDWGLGHATRNIPLISALLARGHSVDIISTGRALILLKNKYGKRCNYFDVPSIYAPHPKHSFFFFNFAKSIPKMLLNIRKARMISKWIIANGKYDKVISDCRYDVYDKVSNSYLITHQVRLRAPLIEEIMEQWLYAQSKKFKYTLVPDYEKPNLSGRLSHDLKFMPKSKVKYVGVLSHLRKKRVKQNIDYFITLSGPEPQRTILEQQILLNINKLKGRIVITLGKPESQTITHTKNITVYSFLDTKKQEDIMNRAKCIVSRSGYTTVMDLVELGKKKVLFIPTPGQTEQEYLSRLLSQRSYFYSVSQKKLDLAIDVEKAKKYKGFTPSWKTAESTKYILKLIGCD